MRVGPADPGPIRPTSCRWDNSKFLFVRGPALEEAPRCRQYAWDDPERGPPSNPSAVAPDSTATAWESSRNRRASPVLAASRMRMVTRWRRRAGEQHGSGAPAPRRRAASWSSGSGRSCNRRSSPATRVPVQRPACQARNRSTAPRLAWSFGRAEQARRGERAEPAKRSPRRAGLDGGGGSPGPFLILTRASAPTLDGRNFSGVTLDHRSVTAG
jgi:hypothetical protein